MAIIEEKPITMAEVMALAGEGERSEAIKKYIKGYVRTSQEDAQKMREELKGLNILKLKDSHIVKIIDFMPETLSELNKIIGENSLDADEITKILDVVKKY